MVLENFAHDAHRTCEPQLLLLLEIMYYVIYYVLETRSIQEDCTQSTLDVTYVVCGTHLLDTLQSVFETTILTDLDTHHPSTCDTVYINYAMIQLQQQQHEQEEEPTTSSPLVLHEVSTSDDDQLDTVDDNTTDEDDTAAHAVSIIVSDTTDDEYDDNTTYSPLLGDPFNETDMNTRLQYLMRTIRNVEERTSQDMTQLDTIHALFPWQDRTVMSLPVRIPFVHIVRYMMGPLYVVPHMGLLNRLLAYLYTLNHEDGADRATVYHENLPALSVLDPVQVNRYVRVTQSLYSLLRRMSAVRVRLVTAPDTQTLQQIYTDRAVHEYWHGVNGSRNFVARTLNTDLRYTETLHYLRIWYEITVHNNRPPILATLPIPYDTRVVRIRVALETGARVPFRATTGAYAFDLVASEDAYIRSGERLRVRVGINRIQLPPDTYLHVISRSGLALTGICVANAPGLVDNDYTGPLCVLMENRRQTGTACLLNNGDRIAQCEVYNEGRCCRNVEWTHVNEAVFRAADMEQNAGARGQGGFGSTGRH